MRRRQWADVTPLVRPARQLEGSLSASVGAQAPGTGGGTSHPWLPRGGPGRAACPAGKAAATAEPRGGGGVPRAAPSPLHRIALHCSAAALMEPGAAAAPALLLPLSEAEQQCYAELFARCRPGPAPEAAAGGSGVAELFRASQLPADALHQVGECGAPGCNFAPALPAPRARGEQLGEESCRSCLHWGAEGGGGGSPSQAGSSHLHGIRWKEGWKGPHHRIWLKAGWAEGEGLLWPLAPQPALPSIT